MTNSKLHEKLAKVQAKLKSIPENGWNDHSRYHYSTAEDIIEAVRPACTSEGLTVVLSVESCEMLPAKVDSTIIDNKAALVWVSITVTDYESGESVTAKAPGYAEDKKGDKASYKAITGASKYAIRSFFCLSSGDDPENEKESQAQQSKSGSNNQYPMTDAPAPRKLTPLPISPQRELMDKFLSETGMSRTDLRDEARKILGRQDINKAEDLSVKEIEALIAAIRLYH